MLMMIDRDCLLKLEAVDESVGRSMVGLQELLSKMKGEVDTSLVR